jgi:hypothetical protein
MRWLAFLGCVFCASVSARAGIVLDAASAFGSFSVDEGASLSNSDGPYFASLDPVPGIAGLKVTGSAAMVYTDNRASSSNITLEFSANSSGVLTEPVIRTWLDFYITANWSDPFFHDVFFNLTLILNGSDFYAPASMFFRTDAATIHQQWSPDFDVQGYLGNQVSYFSVRFQIGADDYHQPGDGISILIPDQSLDFGVAGPSAIPEPAGWMQIIAGLAAIGGSMWRQRRKAAGPAASL